MPIVFPDDLEFYPEPTLFMPLPDAEERGPDDGQGSGDEYPVPAPTPSENGPAGGVGQQ